MEHQRNITSKWFESLRDDLCLAFESIESEFAAKNGLEPGRFKRKTWDRESSESQGDNGGGVMSIMHGNVFEKVGVNISIVHGEFSEEFRKKIPGADQDPKFFATGISVVAHMCSPLVPAMHFNTRYIETSKSWFGGGGDLTPMYEDNAETSLFHAAFQEACDKHDPAYYPKFKKACDEYFYLKHRKEARGVGGIFYDYLSNEFDSDFAFTQDVGRAILDVYPRIVRDKMYLSWNNEQRQHQLVKRGRYVEFNLLYDRGTTFGLSTGGNVEAILMSLPPEVKWP
ncbi:MAG: oxygen-dependent coproporphyrinogen oxidase [Rickettsiaceae bacterium]|nr:oxygen-dependent coproporphyrinogen oxidase [Rickettsiaceae bacterium]